MQLRIKEQQLEGARESLAALQEGLKNAKAREKYYKDLLDKGLSAYELAQIAGMIGGQVLSQIGNAYSVASSVAHLLPQIGSLFALTYGGEQIGAALGAVGQAYKAQAEMASFGSSLAATLGGSSAAPRTGSSRRPSPPATRCRSAGRSRRQRSRWRSPARRSRSSAA